MNKIKSYFKSDSLYIQIIAALIVAGIIWIFTLLYGLFKGLNFTKAINYSVELLQTKISLFWLIIILIIVSVILIRSFQRSKKEFQKFSYSREQIDNKLNAFSRKLDNKLDQSKFESFYDDYNCKRLKNHPFHEIYANDAVEVFIKMIQEGNKKENKHKLETGMGGLVAELKEKKWIHNSDKNKVKNEIENCFTNDFIHQKNELNKVLEEIEVK